MAKTPNPDTFTKAELLKLVLEQRVEIERLRTELESLKRKQARQAAPFTRNQPKKNPKLPGRKPGAGIFTYRTPPARSNITQIIDVPAPETCPNCTGLLNPFKTEFAYLTDLPESKPSISEYRVSVNRCPTCKQNYRGIHPSIASDQRGATAHRLGPRAIAAGHALQYDFGIFLALQQHLTGLGRTARKVSGVLKMLSGLEVSQSALTQQALKRGANDTGLINQNYQALRANVRTASVDSTVAQAAVVRELANLNPKMRGRDLYQSAMAVGFDHIGSLINTLVLAYAGASLPLFVLIRADQMTLGRVLNLELIATEIVHALVGSIGLILAVPIATFLAAVLFVGSRFPGMDNVHTHVRARPLRTREQLLADALGTPSREGSRLMDNPRAFLDDAQDESGKK